MPRFESLFQFLWAFGVFQQPQPEADIGHVYAKPDLAHARYARLDAIDRIFTHRAYPMIARAIGFGSNSASFGASMKYSI